MPTFGRQLARWRDERHLKQSDLARVLDVSSTHISNLERDLSPSARKAGKLPQPTRELCDTISEKLGIPLAEVYIAAGYLPPDGAPRDFRSIRLLGYFEQLPPRAQDDAITIIEALWRRHVLRSGGEEAAEDPPPIRLAKLNQRTPL